MKVNIGRSPQADIRVGEEWDTVSNDHASIELQGEQLVFTDHSTNGTLINNQKIHNTTVDIFPGDKILLAGRFELSWNVLSNYFPHLKRPTVTRNIRGDQGGAMGRATVPNNMPPAGGGQQMAPGQTVPSGQWGGGQGYAGGGQGYDGGAQGYAGGAQNSLHSRPTDYRNPAQRGPAGGGFGGGQQPAGGVPRRNSGFDPLSTGPVGFPGKGGDETVPATGGKSDNFGQKNKYSEAEMDKELDKWNWGAFCLNWIWGVAHKQYWTLLIILVGLIPFAGVIGQLAFQVYLGIRGSRLAWNSDVYDSFEAFMKARRIWSIVGICLFVIGIGTWIWLLFFSDFGKGMLSTLTL